MGYAGNQPIYGTFPSDLFTGNGSNTVFTMSSVPGNDAALLVTIDGVRQHTDTYSFSANTLTFSEAPGSGAIIETVNMGSRADVIITEGVYKKTQFTATASQTNFTIPTGYTVGFVDVYLNGIRLVVADDYTATDGSTIILASAAASGDSVEVVAYGTFNVANALLKSGDTMSGNLVVSGTSTLMSPVAIANTTGNTFVIANTGAVTVTGNVSITGSLTTTSNVSTIGTAFSTDANGAIGIGITPKAWQGYKAIQYSSGTNAYGSLSIGTYLSNSIMDLATNYYNDATLGDAYIGAGYSAKYRQYAGTHRFYVAASGTANTSITFNEAARIDASGYLTLPYQPSFFVSDIASTTLRQSEVVFSTTSGLGRHNNGGCYSTSTGRFTAPIAGYYHLTYQLRANNTTGYFHPRFKLNGTSLSHTHTIWGGSLDYKSVGFTCIMYLSAGDYVSVETNGSQNDTGALEVTQCSFSGRLVG